MSPSPSPARSSTFRRTTRPAGGPGLTGGHPHRRPRSADPAPGAVLAHRIRRDRRLGRPPSDPCQRMTAQLASLHGVVECVHQHLTFASHRLHGRLNRRQVCGAATPAHCAPGWDRAGGPAVERAGALVQARTDGPRQLCAELARKNPRPRCHGPAVRHSAVASGIGPQTVGVRPGAVVNSGPCPPPSDRRGHPARHIHSNIPWQEGTRAAPGRRVRIVERSAWLPSRLVKPGAGVAGCALWRTSCPSEEGTRSEAAWVGRCVGEPRQRVPAAAQSPSVSTAAPAAFASRLRVAKTPVERIWGVSTPLGNAQGESTA